MSNISPSLVLQLSHLTGCTAQVYLEYIQRNLPEGVAMEVTKVQGPALATSTFIYISM